MLYRRGDLVVKQKNILTVQDISCVGKCSMTIALPILSASSAVCTPLPTALLSTHGGFKGLHYKDLTADMVDIVRHWERIGLDFDFIYTGFLGSIQQIDIVSKIADKFKTEQTLVLVDPVMADNGKFYSVYSPQMAKEMKKLCSKADILVPNLTEACFLLESEYIAENYTNEYVENLAKGLVGLGAKKVILTGISFEKDKIGALCYDGESFDYIQTDRQGGSFHGTGDIFASTVLAGLAKAFDLKKATELAVNFTADCIKTSVDMGIDKKYGVAFELELGNLISKLKGV